MYLIVVKEQMPEKQLKSFRQFLQKKGLDVAVINADVDIYELHDPQGVKEHVPVMPPMAQVTSAPVKWAASAHGVVGGLYDLGKSAYGAAEAIGGMAAVMGEFTPIDGDFAYDDDDDDDAGLDPENPRSYPKLATASWECGTCSSPECMVSPAGVFTCAACGWTSGMQEQVVADGVNYMKTEILKGLGVKGYVNLGGNGQNWPAKAVAVPLSATPFGPFAFDAVYKPTLEDIKAATANAIETYGLPALIVSLAETTGPFPMLAITLKYVHVDNPVLPVGFSMTELQAWGAVEAHVQSLMPAGVALILKEADS